VTGGGSSLPEVQRLLAVLAAGKKCAEVGTAFGEGAAAIASTARSVVTVELDLDRVSIAAYRLRRFPNVELLAGDWRDQLPQRGPFELLFFDGGRLDEAPDAIDLVAVGGLIVKDDLSPDWEGPDPVRELLFNHPDLVAVELLTTPQTAAVLAVRLEARDE
jgi:predicted O-methyltransferase YrrM